MAKKKKAAAGWSAIIDENPRRLRLARLEDEIQAMKCSGKLWDHEDPYVQEILDERDSLRYELEPQLGGKNSLNFREMSDDDWDKITNEVKDELEEKGDSYQ